MGFLSPPSAFWVPQAQKEAHADEDPRYLETTFI